MSVVFIHPQTKVPKTIQSGFNWIQFFFNFWGISSFIYGLVSEGLFLVVLYIAYSFAFMGTISNHAVTRGNVIGLLITGGLLLLYSLYLGAYSNRLRAYKLVKKGYLIKDADNPHIAKQLKRWKIRGSVVKNYKEVQPHQSNTPISNLDELEKLAKLRDSGVITEDEFNIKKKELLGL